MLSLRGLSICPVKSGQTNALQERVEGYMNVKWKRRLKLMRISTVAIIIALLLLLLFAGFTIYGNKVGNFIVSAENNGAKLSLSMEEDLSDSTSRLSIGALSGQSPATYTDIPDEISEGLGVKHDTTTRRYLAFSFYLVNAGTSAVDYDMTLDITGTVGDPLSVLRIMIIEGDTSKTNGTVYAKDEESEEGKAQLEKYTTYTTTSLISDKKVFNRRVTEFLSGERIKYTVVIWIEGWDIECTDARIGDSVKMQMDFSAV
jgi:hypothetical protein